jgi:GNAT superfamily N-acetyltransferase
MQAFDNVIWAALTGPQARFSEGGELARRFQPDVTTLAAVREQSAEALQELASLFRPGEAAGVFLPDAKAPVPGLASVRGFNVAAMIHERPVHLEAVDGRTPPGLNPLSTEHSPQMIALTKLTEPGPFGSRTHELGNYFGIFDGERLVAMAGERMRFPGYAEVSAVCTHPDYTGRGYAAALVAAAVQRIRERGEIPFLHVREDNDRAIRVYERLGFVTLRVKPMVVLAKKVSQ